jgi:Putative prokaryotic signal transducing protein
MAAGFSMVHLYTPRSEIELLLLRSVFDGAGIRYFVRNEAFGSLTVGPQIEHYNRKSIYVAEADFEEAIALVREFHLRTADHGAAPAAATYGFGDKARMLLEFLVFGWFMPGRRPIKSPELRLIKNDDPRPERPPRRRRPPLRLVPR